MILPNQRWELFCQGIVTGKSAVQAYTDAGYKPKAARVSGPQLLSHPVIQGRIKELNEMALTPKIMSKTERMERLSEIARARPSDFVTAGPDGSWVNIGMESLNSAALQSVKSRTEYDDNGDHPAVVTEIKLHPPVQAIAELNKMLGDYEPVESNLNVKGKIKTEQTTIVVGNGNLTSALSSLVDAGAVKVSVN